MKESSGQAMLEALWIMRRAREGDRPDNLLFRQSLRWLQLPGAGHEATAVLDLALDPADFVFPYYGCNMIQRSVRTTLVTQEDNRTGSLGQTIISDAVSDAGLWRFMKASPLLLARPNVHVPFHPKLELAILPSTSAVVEAVRELVMNSGGGE